jgi:dGTPase
LTPRELYEQFEEETLSNYAALSKNSKGRQVPIKPCPLRTEFQRDRDRIIHCKAFRRLTHKTQVFLAPEGDHYRTRLTHTLEVSQISRTIARSLRLNEDLTEAIALAHDLGHTPFGHIGEEALTAVFAELRKEKVAGVPDSFKHNEQSLRVVDLIEYEGKGLNLTWEVRDGILNHTGPVRPATLEGQIVKIADRIAYINHDIDDAIRGGILKPEDLPQDLIEVLGHRHGIRINNMVNDLVEASRGRPVITQSNEFAEAMNKLRDFLFERVYTDPIAKSEDKKAKGVLRRLFLYYFEHPEALPAEFYPENQEELVKKVCDYVAGMTDRFAIRTYQKIFVPKTWMV